MKASGGVEVSMENELMEYHYIIYQKIHLIKKLDAGYEIYGLCFQLSYLQDSMLKGTWHEFSEYSRTW